MDRAIRVGVALIDRALEAAIEAMVARTPIFTLVPASLSTGDVPGADVVVAQAQLVADAAGIGTHVDWLRRHACELVAVLDGPTDRALLQVVRGRVRGLLSLDDPAGDYGRAIGAVAAGGCWVSPWLAPRLLEFAVAGADGEPVLLAEVSPREREVLALLADGGSNRDIGLALGISTDTVKEHVSSLLRKLGVRNRAQLAVAAHAHLVTKP